MPLPPPRTSGRYRVAIVCMGNICRSPMAQVVLERELEDAGLHDRVEVVSSGTGGWHVGKPMDRRAAATLTAGYSAGQIIGPLIATPLLRHGYHQALLLAAAIVLTAAITALAPPSRLLAATRRPPHRTPAEPAE